MLKSTFAIPETEIFDNYRNTHTHTHTDKIVDIILHIYAYMIIGAKRKVIC